MHVGVYEGARVGLCSILLYRSNNLRLSYCKSAFNLFITMYYPLSCYGYVILFLYGRGLGVGGWGSGVGKGWDEDGGGGSLPVMSAGVGPLDAPRPMCGVAVLTAQQVTPVGTRKLKFLNGVGRKCVANSMLVRTNELGVCDGEAPRSDVLCEGDWVGKQGGGDGRRRGGGGGARVGRGDGGEGRSGVGMGGRGGAGRAGLEGEGMWRCRSTCGVGGMQ